MWGYILGGAGLLAFILGLFAFYNSGVTRKLIGKILKTAGNRNSQRQH